MNIPSLPYKSVVLVLVALVISGCVQPVQQQMNPPDRPDPTDSPQPVPSAEDTLRLIYWEAPTILNPHLSGAFKDHNASRVSYEPLASFNQDGEMVPFLAADIPSQENGGLAPDKTWVIWKLKEGVQWSDGHPFTAHDVKFTYTYITNPEVSSFSTIAYDQVERVEVLDDYRVKVVFKGPNPAWYTPFVGVSGIILPRHLFADYNGPNAHDAPANFKPAGTGPYCVTSFEQQDTVMLHSQPVQMVRIVYERNPFFHEPGKPFFSRVELWAGGSSQYPPRAVLEEGSADFTSDIQVFDTDLERLEAMGHARVSLSFDSKIYILDLNHTDPSRGSVLEHPHPFLSDKRVRQAFALAIDREAIANRVYGDIARPISNVLIMPQRYHSPNMSYTFSLAKAAALLDEAGWQDSDGDGVRDKNGVPLKVRYQAVVNPPEQEIQRMIKRNLERIGVAVETTVVDAGVFFGGDVSRRQDTVTAFRADLQSFHLLMDSPDPAPHMGIWTCAQIPHAPEWSVGFNTARWCSPAYDALYERAANELDAEQRQRLFIAMNDLLIEDVVVIPLVHIADLYAINTTLHGVALTPWDVDVWNIKDWARR